MLDRKIVIAMLAFLFNGRGDNISTIQKIETKESENGFLGLSHNS